MDLSSPTVSASVDGDGAPVASSVSAVMAFARQPRAAAIAFAVLLAVAVPVLLSYGSHLWFFADEWGFLVGKDAGRSWFAPQNQHWSTAPIIGYQALFAGFGITTYTPYLLVVICMHLGLATLIRTVMRRAGVRPWVATACAATFVLFGPGEQNILSPVQISMVGTMLCGFAQMILSDHDGPIRRRDVAALAFGVLSLTTSAIAPVLVVTVGACALLRRRWLAAAFHTVPLGLIYGVWYLTFRTDMGSAALGRPQPDVVAAWIRSGVTGVFEALAHGPVLGALLGAVMVIGLGLAWRGHPSAHAESDESAEPTESTEATEAIEVTNPPAWRRQLCAPTALLLGPIVLMGLLPFSARVFFGPDLARSSRYVSMAAAMTLPALAVAIDAIGRRTRDLGLALAYAPLAIGLVLNATAFNINGFTGAFFERQRQLVWAYASNPLATAVPRTYIPDKRLFGIDRVDIGFLLDAKASDRLPVVSDLPASIVDEAAVNLLIDQQPLERHPDAGTCPAVAGAFRGTLRQGQRLVIGAATKITVTIDSNQTSPVAFEPDRGPVLVAHVRDVQLVTDRPPAATPLHLCP